MKRWWKDDGKMMERWWKYDGKDDGKDDGKMMERWRESALFGCSFLHFVLDQ